MHPCVSKATYGKIPNGVLALGPKGELLSAGRDKQVRLWSPSGGAVKSFASETALTPEMRTERCVIGLRKSN